MSDSFLLSFNVQCRGNDDRLDIASQHESPTYNCSRDNYHGYYMLDGDCPYIGRRLLKKARPANENDDYCHVFLIFSNVIFGGDENFNHGDICDCKGAIRNIIRFKIIIPCIYN